MSSKKAKPEERVQGQGSHDLGGKKLTMLGRARGGRSSNNNNSGRGH